MACSTTTSLGVPLLTAAATTLPLPDPVDAVPDTAGDALRLATPEADEAFEGPARGAAGRVADQGKEAGEEEEQGAPVPSETEVATEEEDEAAEEAEEEAKEDEELDEDESEERDESVEDEEALRANILVW